MKYKLFPWLIGFLLLVVILFASFSAPAITQLDPAEKFIKATYNAPFTIHFSHIMHRRSVEENFLILPKTEGEFRWKDLRTLEFMPDELLTIGDEYRIVIKGEAKSIWMKQIGYDLTIDYKVTGPPYVLFSDPSAGEVIISDKAITVMFDRPMDFESRSDSDLIKIDPSLSGNIEYFGLSAFQFFPKSLKPAQTYEITIPAGLSAIDGGETAEDYSWIITTPDLKVENSQPAAESKEVAVNQVIRIFFDGEVPLESVKPGTNALLYPSNDLDADVMPKMDGFFNTEVTYEVNEEGEPIKTILVFAPTFDYQPGEDYRFVLKSDKDLHLEEDFELEFKTVDLMDKETAEEVAEKPAEEPATWQPPQEKVMQFFIRGENPRLKLDEPLTASAVLSVCQIPSNEYIRVTAQNSWDSYRCKDTEPETIGPGQNGDALTINLNDYFRLNWVTGVYFVSITQGEEKLIRHFLIEDSTLLLKRSDSDLLLWALDVKSGEPIADMEVEVLAFDGEIITKGKTDEMGVYSLNQSLDEGIYLRAKKEDDGISRWGFVADRWLLEGDGAGYDDEDSTLLVFLNQQIFFPGDEVKIKGIWRELNDYVLSLPEATQVTVTLEDSQQNYVVSKRIPLRRNGSFDGTVAIPENMLSGNYWISVSDLNHQRMAQPVPLQVKDESSDLRLEWINADKHHAYGTTPVYFAKARYQNGLPAPNIKGHYKLFREPLSKNFQEGAINYRFESLDSTCNENCDKRTLVREEDFEFDSDGEVKLFLKNSNDEFLEPGYDYELLLSSESDNEETVNLYHRFEVHQGDFDLGLGLRHALIQAGETIDVSVLATDHSGNPDAGRKVKLSLITYDSERKTVYENSVETGAVSVSASLPVAPTLEDGLYLLRAESRDDERNEIVAEQMVVLNTNPLLPVSDQLLLAVDQSKYFVGGRAHLIINEPEASEDDPVPVLVTYERDGLLGYETLELSEAVTPLAVPITESMMPHFLVTVTRFNRGIFPTFDSDSRKIEVGNDESHIFVDLSYEPQTPIPGEELSLKIRTYDYQNRPLSAVLTLNVLDAETEDVLLSYNSFFSQGTKPMQAASNISLNQSDQISEGPLPANEIIPENVQSVFFDPLITTTVGGETSIPILLPEEKNNFNIQILATKGEGQFGSSIFPIQINQQLEIRPVLPSFVSPGDQTVFAAAVKNISELVIQGQFEIAGSDITVKGDSSRNFSLQPGQQTEIPFSVYISDTTGKDYIDLTFKTDSNSFSTKIPLKQLKTCTKIANTGLLEDVWTGMVNFPQSAYPGLGSLQLTMSGEPLSIAKVQADALSRYAYDSTYLLAARLLTTIAQLPDLPSENDLVPVRSFVSELLKKADANGAYRYWNEPDASARLSAFVLKAFLDSIAQGIHIDSIQLNRTVEFLSKTLNAGSLSLDDQVFVLWTLSEAGQFDTERALDYFQDRDHMSLQARIFMLMTFDQLIQAGQSSVGPVFDTLKTELADEVIQEGNFAYFDAPVKTTALALYAFSLLDSADPLLKPFTSYLVYQGGDLIGEFDPEEALWLVLAFHEYAKQSDTTGVNYIAQVKLNGEMVLDQSVTGNSADKVYETVIDAERLNEDGINDLFVKKNGSGPLYLDAHLTSFMDSSRVSRLEDGMILVRKLYEINDGVKKEPVSIRRGKNYLSELSFVVPESFDNVVLTDEIPPGFRVDSDDSYLDTPFSQKYFKQGRMLYFAPHLPAGVYTVSTGLQAVLPGTFKLMPAAIQPMFESKVMSRTTGGTIQVLE